MVISFVIFRFSAIFNLDVSACESAVGRNPARVLHGNMDLKIQYMSNMPNFLYWIGIHGGKNNLKVYVWRLESKSELGFKKDTINLFLNIFKFH